MVFEGLSDRLQDIFKKLRGKGKISEDDVRLAMREIRLALLEADVNFKVVKDFIGQSQRQSGRSGVLTSLTPGSRFLRCA